MAERGRGRNSGEPDYTWLYGDRKRSGRGDSGAASSGAAGGTPPAGGSSDPEPTRVMPTMNRPQAGQDRPRTQIGDHDGGGAPPGRRPVPSGPAPRPPKPSLPKRRPRLRWLKILLLLWLVFLLAVPFWAWTKVTKVDAEPEDRRPDSQPGHTYLLVGSDSREGLTAKERREYGTGKAEGRRTDTIMLLHTGSGPNLLMSIPRDSIVEVPGHGTTKINAAYAFGGPQLLVRTVENETGIRIDSYVEIGFGGFVNVVDAVGGVEICPKEAMKDPKANLDVKKGCQEVDGPTALGYARTRNFSTGDIERARNQREVVAAIGKKAASPWSVLNPVRYVRLGNAGAEAVAVGEDTGPFDTLRFAWAMTRVSGKDGLTCGVPIADFAVNWDEDRANRMFRLIKQDRTEDIPKRLCNPSGLAN